MAKSNVIKTSFIQLLITALTFFFGIVMAKYFGASSEMDAYVASATVISLIYGLFVSVQARVLIPHIGSFEKVEEQKKNVIDIFYFNVILSLLLSLILYFYSPLIVSLIVPGLKDSNKLLSANLLRVTSLYLFLSNLASLGKGIVEFHLKPVLSLFIRLIQAIALLLCVFLLHDNLGIYSLPWSHVISVTVVIPLYWLFTLKHKYKYTGKITFWNSSIKKYLLLLSPILIGQLLMRVIKLTDTYLASYLDEGSLSHMSYSLRIVTNFDTLFAGVYVVYFPLLSKLQKQEDNLEHSKVLLDGFQSLFLVALSLTAFTLLFSQEIIEVVFQRGSFTAADTQIVSKLIRCYGLMILCAPIGSYLSNIYYSRQAAGTVTIYSIISSVTNIVLNFVFVKIWGIFGLAFASSIAYFIGNVLQAGNLKKVNKDFKLKSLMNVILKSFIVVVISTSIVFLLKGVTDAYLSTFTLLVCMSIIFFLTTIVVSSYLGLSISRTLLNRFSRKR